MRYLSLKVAFWVDEVLDVPARSVISPATRRTLPAIWAVLIASLIAAFAMVANPAQASPENPAQDEAAYVAAINQVRRDAGVAPLVVDGELTSLSRGWAQQMANDGKISHASHPSDGISRYWLKVGENVGTGPDVSSIMAAFVASPGHYKNIVDPDFKYIGVGVVYSGPAMYTTHRFMKLDEPPPPPPTTPAAPEVILHGDRRRLVHLAFAELLHDLLRLRCLRRQIHRHGAADHSCSPTASLGQPRAYRHAVDCAPQLDDLIARSTRSVNFGVCSPNAQP